MTGHVIILQAVFNIDFWKIEFETRIFTQYCNTIGGQPGKMYENNTNVNSTKL